MDPAPHLRVECGGRGNTKSLPHDVVTIDTEKSIVKKKSSCGFSMFTLILLHHNQKTTPPHDH